MSTVAPMVGLHQLETGRISAQKDPQTPLKESSNQIGIQSLPNGSLHKLIGTIRGHWETIKDYWALFGLVGLGRLLLGRLLISI